MTRNRIFCCVVGWVSIIVTSWVAGCGSSGNVETTASQGVSSSGGGNSDAVGGAGGNGGTSGASTGSSGMGGTGSSSSSASSSSSSSSASSSSSSSSTSGGAPMCPTYAAGVSGGFVLHLSVKEASGVVESRKNPGILWVHNDSGGQPQIFGLTPAGAAKGTYNFSNASATDWEDIAIGPGPVAGQSYVYIGDIGDNGESRANVRIYRAAEPAVVDGLGTVSLNGVEQLTLQYPDKPHNAETLLVDPLNGDLFIVVKAGNGESPVFRAAAPLAFGGTMTMEQVAKLTFGVSPLVGNTTTTGGDISAAGDLIAIRTYDSAYAWRRAPGMSIAEALATEPCPIPIANEGQGESLGFRADGSGYYTLSEGTFVPVHHYAKQ